MIHCLSRSGWQKSKGRGHVHGRSSRSRRRRRDATPGHIQCTVILMHMEFPSDTRLRSVRHTALQYQKREIALRAQTAVSIAALLIIAICHKFWVIVTARTGREGLLGEPLRARAGRRTTMLNTRRNRAAGGWLRVITTGLYITFACYILRAQNRRNSSPDKLHRHRLGEMSLRKFIILARLGLYAVLDFVQSRVWTREYAVHRLASSWKIILHALFGELKIHRITIFTH